jgi:hypothetical protein
MKRLLLFFSILIQLSARAQTCQQFPADCPETGNIEATQDRTTCINNWISQQEIDMQNRLRKFTTDMMEAIAAKNKWQVYELSEMPGAGQAIDGNTKLLPDALRPPYQYSISFIFIVNDDSLRAWQNWYHNDLMEKSNAVTASYQEAGNNTASVNAQQRYTDSANYYGTVMAKYMTDHQDEYQKAITSNDAKAQKKYEDGLKKIQDKVNEYINKANGKQSETLSSANSKSENLQEYRKRNTIAYRNATMLRVSFVFNQNMTPSLSENAKLVKPLTVPNSSFSALFHNGDPDQTQTHSSFATSTDFAFILFGKWNTKSNEYKSYRATYSFDKAATDVTTNKKTPSDKVQTTSVGIEGSTRNINQFIQSLPTQNLNAMIVNQ